MKTHFASKFKIGMAVDPGQAANAVTNAVLLKHASSITAESVMKANPIGVSAGVYNYTSADQLITLAQTNGIEVRGHALLWHQTSPAWFFEGDTTAPGYKATVRARLETYITDVVTHFKGKVYAWDVVNEATSDDASGNYRNSQWYQIFGPDYIEIAFRAARAADPTVQLFINDYGTEDTAKLGRFMAIVDTMLARGVPIDGIGHQLHINSTWPPVANVKAAFVAAETRSLINHVTELDVSLYTTDSGSCYSSPPTGCQAAFVAGTVAYSDALRAQALQYRAMFNLFQEHASVKSVTMWGVADNSTWLSTFPTARLNHPLLFDTAGNPKSAFWAVVDVGFTP
ncbi:endo-1,4-beta-xylanase [Asticcacaulis sp. AC460]|nr:endo-1,4-beta-xylanase [Asticcacaulis sp. AC460]